MQEQFIEGYTNSQLRKLKGVYCFTFPNGKRYVGITYGSGNFANRFCNHLKDVRGNSNYPVHCAIRSFGWQNVKREILLISDDVERVKSLEKQLISFWKLNLKRFKETSRGYNLTDGGDGCCGPTGKPSWRKGLVGVSHHTEESKKLISERSKEMWQDGTHTREKQIERNKKMLLKHPNHYKDLAIKTREANKLFNYEFHFDDGRIEKPFSWREYIRDTFGNERVSTNIRQMLQGKRARVHNIIRIIKYDLKGTLIVDSKIEREKFITKRKSIQRKPNKGCRYIIQEPSGEKVEVQHLTNYCKERGITIFALMRKYKGIYPGVSGYKVIEKIGWN